MDPYFLFFPAKHSNGLLHRVAVFFYEIGGDEGCTPADAHVAMNENVPPLSIFVNE